MSRPGQRESRQRWKRVGSTQRPHEEASSRVFLAVLGAEEGGTEARPWDARVQGILGESA